LFRSPAIYCIPSVPESTQRFFALEASCSNWPRCDLPYFCSSPGRSSPFTTYTQLLSAPLQSLDLTTQHRQCLLLTPCRRICASRFTRHGGRLTQHQITTRTRALARCRRRLRCPQLLSRTFAALPLRTAPSGPWTAIGVTLRPRPPPALHRRLLAGDGVLARPALR